MTTENIIFIWNNKPNNYVKVCLESLRLYNKTCNIFFYYDNKLKQIIEEYKKFNIIFREIDVNESKDKFQYYKLLITKNILKELNYTDKLLILDCDLLFQNNPFLMFDEYPNNDLYYTYNINHYLDIHQTLRKDYNIQIMIYIILIIFYQQKIV